MQGEGLVELMTKMQVASSSRRRDTQVSRGNRKACLSLVLIGLVRLFDSS